MAITINIYDATNNTTKSISVDFIMDIIAFDDPVVTSMTAAFKFITGAKDTGNVGYAPRIVKGLNAATGSLALNGVFKSVGVADNTAYADVKSMITDYVFDYISGHTLNQSGSGCLAKSPMKFSS